MGWLARHRGRFRPSVCRIAARWKAATSRASPGLLTCRPCTDLEQRFPGSKCFSISARSSTESFANFLCLRDADLAACAAQSSSSSDVSILSNFAYLSRRLIAVGAVCEEVSFGGMARVARRTRRAEHFRKSPSSHLASPRYGRWQHVR